MAGGVSSDKALLPQNKKGDVEKCWTYSHTVHLEIQRSSFNNVRRRGGVGIVVVIVGIASSRELAR